MEYEGVASSSRGKQRRNPCLLVGIITFLAFAIILAVVLVCTLKKEHGLRETVLSRCQGYMDANPSASSGNDCERIWSMFEQAYVGKDPCDVPPEAYDPLIKSVQQKVPCNENIFWSKTNDMVHALTKNRDCLMTLEDTLLGFMFNKLTWCSKNGSKETFTTGCPGWMECINPVHSFWTRASANFAATACGNVYVMLNGSINSPFNPESTFASVEVQNFNPATLDGLTVLLVTKDTDVMTCSNKSLMDLQMLLSSGPLQAVTYTCRVIPQAKVKKCIDDLEIPCSDCW
ncbi:ADP-ribosyl cyclase/cyclic ADP-ribose hydrolase 1-like [Myxocyprinus asiaticus]|uniref:ADP-ribosyl cyclase/cyclic ADP-ribose hydrolase 1-like n=1 Tax=Myxocyprinus asiaticus TaxID=70543 RepID=UPI002221A59A|nr:ADP-ribosyl cyclase/cyclic ADP-ribose hydrolase 1-like [Myxocyprinus asiaticus]